MKQVKPVGEFILVRLTKVSKTRGGIVLPGTADRQITIVVDVGDAVTKVKVGEQEIPRFSKGDEVVLHIPNVITLKNQEVEEDLVLVHEDQICCILKPDTTDSN